MSLKIYLPAFLLLLLFSKCEKEVSAEDRFADLTAQEKDSLAKLYHDYSMGFYQPSEMHRRYKDTALMIQPDHVEYRQRLSYSYKKRGEHIEAMRILNEAVERDLKHHRTRALQYRAWSLLFFYRDYEGTIRDVDLINEMETDNDYTVCHGEPCNVLKGQALYKLGRYREAIAVFDKVLETEQKKGWDPLDNWHANFYKARCLFESGSYTEARGIYNEQIKANPEFTEAHFQLGRIAALLGEKEKALSHFKKAEHLLLRGNKMGEPYYEAFDEVFPYQIQEEIKSLQL